MHVVLIALALLGIAPAGLAATDDEPVGPALVHAFRGAADATAAADVEIVVRSRKGQVRLGGASGRERIDLADYSGVLGVVLRRDLLAGPGDPPILLPAGSYEGDVLATSSGALRLVLHGASGLRVSLALAEAESPDPPPPAAIAEAMPQPGDAWWIALHLPTASGAFVLAPAGTPVPVRTRTGIIGKRLRERLMHTGMPVRRPPRPQQ